jgi:hypothetical protein
VRLHDVAALRVRSVAVLALCPAGSEAPTLALEVCLEDGAVYHIHVADVSGKVPHV